MLPDDKNLHQISYFPKKRHNFLLRLHTALPTRLNDCPFNVSCGDIAVVRGRLLLPLRLKTLVGNRQEHRRAHVSFCFIQKTEAGLMIRPSDSFEFPEDMLQAL